LYGYSGDQLEQCVGNLTALRADSGLATAAADVAANIACPEAAACECANGTASNDDLVRCTEALDLIESSLVAVAAAKASPPETADVRAPASASSTEHLAEMYDRLITLEQQTESLEEGVAAAVARATGTFDWSQLNARSLLPVPIADWWEGLSMPKSQRTAAGAVNATGNETTGFDIPAWIHSFDTSLPPFIRDLPWHALQSQLDNAWQLRRRVAASLGILAIDVILLQYLLPVRSFGRVLTFLVFSLWTGAAAFCFMTRGTAFIVTILCISNAFIAMTHFLWPSKKTFWFS
jgi:hypothetical protein